jgi:glucokinase
MTEAAPHDPTAIGVDIGGSGLRAARVTPAGIVAPVLRRDLDASLAPGVVIDRIRDVVRELGWAACDVGVGVGIPAFLDSEGAVRFCVNLPGLNGVVLPNVLADIVPAEAVIVLPDVAAAATAEAQLGAGREVDRFLCVAIGTGVNAAMMVDGRVLETAAGCLGDAGHVLVEPDGPRCECGGVGCLEAVGSGGALGRAGRSCGFMDAAAVVDAARMGDTRAAAIVDRAGVALGRAIAIWCAMLWPGRVAVAGGVAAAGELLLAPARHELRRVGVPYLTQVEIVPAQLGADAGLAGSGLAALARVPLVPPASRRQPRPLQRSEPRPRPTAHGPRPEESS